MSIHWRQRSLRTRLVMGVVGWALLVWLVAAAVTWRDAHDELDMLLDGHLAQAAALLVMQQANTPEEASEADAPVLHKYAPQVAFQVFHEGELVLHSPNTGTEPMAPQTQGFATVELQDGPTARQRWRVFAARGAERDVQVYVGERLDARQGILWALLRSVLWPLALALPLLALAGWWAVRQGLRPVDALSLALKSRATDALEPVTLPDVPPDMQPLLDALNGLLQRMGQMLESERRFTADAAHELRTPIAAIRAQAQVAWGAGSDAAQRQHALQATLAGCDRASRVVEQLLTLARLEAQGSVPLQTVDVSAVAREVLADLVPAALTREQTLSLDAPQSLPVQADAVLLAVLLRNLVDNALRYSPSGASVAVVAQRQADAVCLTVQDSGPGMADAELARLGGRFRRLQSVDASLGASATASAAASANPSGSGLGWSIVRRLADVLGVEVRAQRSATLGGLSVEVRWPAP